MQSTNDQTWQQQHLKRQMEMAKLAKADSTQSDFNYQKLDEIITPIKKAVQDLQQRNEQTMQ